MNLPEKCVQHLHYKPCFNPLLLRGGGGGDSFVGCRGDLLNRKDENSFKTFVSFTAKNSASGSGSARSQLSTAAWKSFKEIKSSFIYISS
jgi:hypothetical protein